VLVGDLSSASQPAVDIERSTVRLVPDLLGQVALAAL
jgi:hypothetical protein